MIKIPLDVKSLFMNIKNDNEKGHTATVSTAIKQGNSVNTESIKVLDVNENIPECSKDSLITKIQSKAKAKSKIIKILAFKNVLVNNEPVGNESCFCIFVREETDKDNVQYGRQKLHYPMSLEYEDEDITINNKEVLNLISRKIKNYAFIVNYFEIDENIDSINLDLTIVGNNGIPYSKVFVNKKGTGNKFIDSLDKINAFESYDTEIISLREKIGYNNVDVNNYEKIVKNNYEIAMELAKDFMKIDLCDEILNVNEIFPYCIYDLECKKDNFKKYCIVKCTSNKEKNFILTAKEFAFLNDFRNSSILILITDVLGLKDICIYDSDVLTKMSKKINSIVFKDGD